MIRDFDRRGYWERKILRWESSRYSGVSRLWPASWTVRRRLRQAEAAIRATLPAGGSIAELGCGSGLLAQRLRGHYARYFGKDLAENAIREARARALPEATFERGDALQGEVPHADLIVFLGLVDWLSDAEIGKLFGGLGNPRFLLFSYTEAPVPWNPYRLYRAVYDRVMGGGVYRARSFTAHEVAGWISRFQGARAETLPARFFDPGRLVLVRQSQEGNR